eukprot:scaffold16428_cov63-Phaeocystis_antarctica.AAC.4
MDIAALSASLGVDPNSFPDAAAAAPAAPSAQLAPLGAFDAQPAAPPPTAGGSSSLTAVHGLEAPSALSASGSAAPASGGGVSFKDLVVGLMNDPSLSDAVKEQISVLDHTYSTNDKVTFFSKLKDLVGKERIKQIMLLFMRGAAPSAAADRAPKRGAPARPSPSGARMEPSAGAKHASSGSTEPAAKRVNHGKLPMTAQAISLTRGPSEVNERPEHAYVPGPVQRCAGDESRYDWGTLTVKPLPPPRDADVEKCAGCRYAFAPEAQLRECPRCSRRFHEPMCWGGPGSDPDPADPDFSGFCRVCLPPGASAEEAVLVWIADQFEKAGLSVVLVEKISNADSAARFTEQSVLLSERADTGGVANMQRLFHLSGAGFGHLCEKGLEISVARAGLFGRGLYFSAQPGKCDNYWRKATKRGDGGAVVAAHTGKDPKTTRAMYCTKVLLGRTFQHAKGRYDKRLTTPPRGFDSVAGNCNGEPESVVYDAARTELEYLIHYEVSSEIADLEAQGYDAEQAAKLPARAQGPAKAMLHAGGASTSTTSMPQHAHDNVRFTAVPRANLDLAKEIKWKVLSPGEWEAGTLDPVMFSELGEDGEEVVRLPCHSEATSCTMNRSTAETAFRNSNNCPCCQQLYPLLPGPQPSGVMSASGDRRDCEGHAACDGCIAVRYEFEGGVQLDQHPEPGKIYHGAKRSVYLPNDDAGSKALQLLKLAFERGLLFRVGKSVTTGKTEDGIVWNGIHQKTRRDGGAANHGYPDPTFLQRLQSECALHGVRLPDGAGGGDRAPTAGGGRGAASEQMKKMRNPSEEAARNVGMAVLASQEPETLTSILQRRPAAPEPFRWLPPLVRRGEERPVAQPVARPADTPPAYTGVPGFLNNAEKERVLTAMSRAKQAGLDLAASKRATAASTATAAPANQGGSTAN